MHLYSLTLAREARGEAPVASKRESKRSTTGRRPGAHRTTSESGGSSHLHHQASMLSSSPLASGELGTSPVAPSLVFTGHRRAVLVAAYLHFERLVASMDSSLLLLWDPVTGQKVGGFLRIISFLQDSG